MEVSGPVQIDGRATFPNVPGGYNVPIDFQAKYVFPGGVEMVVFDSGRNGILFECPVAFSKGDHVECIMSVSFLLSREISFGIEVKYCYADHGSHILGASIDTISDEVWFDAFVEVHDFMCCGRAPYDSYPAIPKAPAPEGPPCRPDR